MVTAVGWSLNAWVVWLDIDTPLKAEVNVEKAAGELQTGKDLCLCTFHLATDLPRRLRKKIPK